MGLFDKLKDKLAEQAVKQSAAVAKAAARKSAEAAVAVAKAAGLKMEEALYGEREREPPKPDQKKREAEVAEMLRAADRRVKERDAEEKKPR
jgi:hypothetical protein